MRDIYYYAFSDVPHVHPRTWIGRRTTDNLIAAPWRLWMLIVQTKRTGFKLIGGLRQTLMKFSESQQCCPPVTS